MSKKNKTKAAKNSHSVPALVNIDRNIAVGFSTLILIMMVIVLSCGVIFFQRISNRDEDQLQEIITGILADSIDRVSFSGKYHARLLIEQIAQSQPRIRYVMIVGTNGHIIAHSDPSMNNKMLDIEGIEAIPKVINSDKAIISDKKYHGKSVRQITMPYRSGYGNRISGVIVVGISTEEVRQEIFQMWIYMGIIIASLLLFSLGAAYALGKLFAGPVKSMAWQLKGILDHAPLLVSISDRVSRENVTSLSFNGLTDEAPELLNPELDEVFSKNHFVNREVTRFVGGMRRTYLINSFPIIQDSSGDTSMACSIALDVTDRKMAEESLRESQANLQITLNSIGDAVIATDSNGKIVRMNPVAQELTGWSIDEAEGVLLEDVFKTVDTSSGGDVKFFTDGVAESRDPKSMEFNLTLISKDNVYRKIANTYSAIRNDFDVLVGFVLVFRDITQELALQEQLRQAQKMDAIGQLAGGVAHDFNNLLTAITGNADLLKLKKSDDNLVVDYADAIISASDRAAELVKQLMAFSRKGQIQIIDLDVHHIIKEVVQLLSHSIDKRIALETQLQAQDTIVKGDPALLQSAILNLGLNARDAMPIGGKLVVSTRNIFMDNEACQLLAYDIAPGEYVEIAVIDNGVGMDEEVQIHIFEPFFTTKKPGMGTGLGLAGVYGCMESHGGMVSVYSKPGQGSSFKLLLPLSSAKDGTFVGVERKLIYGTGNVLVVDDEDIVRNFATNTLTELGYTVVTCSDGYKAVEYIKEHKGEVDLVILDMSMPKISGEDTFKLIIQIEPDIRVLLSSGYSESEVVNSVILQGARSFISKPFGMEELSQQVDRNIRKPCE